MRVFFNHLHLSLYLNIFFYLSPTYVIHLNRPNLLVDSWQHILLQHTCEQEKQDERSLERNRCVFEETV